MNEVKENKTESTFIKSYDNMVDPTTCDAIMEWFDNEQKFQRTMSRNKDEKSSQVMRMDEFTFINSYKGGPGSHFKGTKYLEVSRFDQLSIGLGMALDRYLVETGISGFVGFDTLYWEPFKIQKTKPGEGFHSWHIEKTLDNTSISSKRVLVWTLYLNDIEEGGETEFLFQHTRIKSKKGRVCFFPAHFPYVHRGNPPLKDTKYIATSWLTV